MRGMVGAKAMLKTAGIGYIYDAWAVGYRSRDWLE